MAKVKPRLKTSAELVTHERTTLPLGTLIPDKKNPRRPMTAKEHADLRESIKTYGIVEELVVRKEDRRIVGGHQRKEDIRAALIELGHTPEEADAYLVPVCLVANLSEKKTLALNLALNKIGGGFNYELVAEVLDEINGDFVTGFSEQEASDLKALSEIEVVPGDMPGERGHVLVMKFESKADVTRAEACLRKWGGMAKKRDAGAAMLRIVAKLEEASS